MSKLISGFATRLAGPNGAALVGFKKTAIAGAVQLSMYTKAAEIVSLRDFGAIGDGQSHPLSERFETLAKAQEVYPHATSLTNEIDWAATQAAIDAFTQRYAAYPKHDMYSRGTLKGPSNARITIDCGTGEYRLHDTVDITYRGFINFVGNGAVFRAKLAASNAKPLFDVRYSNEVLFDGVVWDAADNGAIRFLHCVLAGGSDNKVADSTIAAKAVHFMNCEMRNPGDTGLNAVNDTGTVKAGIDNSTFFNLFFAGGAVGLKHAGAECWLYGSNFASQTYGGVMLYDNASLSCFAPHFTLANAAPAFLIDTDNNIDSLRVYSVYAEQCTYLVQALGNAANKKANIIFEGGRVESQQSGLIAMANRVCTVTMKDVQIGNTNNNTTIACGNTASTLVIEQNQIDVAYGGASMNTASWAGKVARQGFVFGNPINNVSYAPSVLYVDHVAGNDRNDGYHVTRALATLAEALKRVNDRGETQIYLSTGTDASPAVHVMPANSYQYGGHIYIARWEKYAGQAQSAAQRCIIDCSTNSYRLKGGTFELQLVKVTGLQAIKQYGGVLDLKSVVVPCSDANGHIFVKSGTVLTNQCSFEGSAGVAFYIGDQYGVQANLWGYGNTWGAGITKYQAWSGLNTLVLSTL